MRVAVVGAGLAGLSAAESLLAGGAEVTLIEAEQRFGGRTRTIHDAYVGGQYAESGAEWVDSIHWRMLDLMQRFDIETLGERMPWSTIRRWVYWNGLRYTGSDIAKLEPNVIEAIELYENLCEAPAPTLDDPSQPHLHSDAEFLDSRSLADLIRECNLGPVGQLFARRGSQGEFASEPDKVSALFVAQQRAFEKSEVQRQGIGNLSSRVKGGVSQIAQALGRDLIQHPRLTLKLGCALTSVEQTSDGVVVGCSNSEGLFELAASHVVLACSLVPLRNVDFRSEIPTALREAMWGLGYGPITKTAVQFANREWDSGYGTTDSLSQRLYDPSVDQDGDSGIVMAYCGGDGGRELATQSEAERIDVITRDMRTIHGITAPSTGAFSRAWLTEPNYGGAYATYEPGQVTKFWEVLRQPWGRVHLAGEHVATCTGYMEGAVESGRDVADRILRNS
ncbi:MAG: NAD(P)/FAD-dependent oxidoreductase [Actinomycetes bacterium]